ncbi:uridine phosphorylase [Anoxynatronum buryatiense]|uniref:Uridine phosphorylase n=1 Tax=Anoxynatronum buryatiense TaxID=489973 RepID=A0AA46AJG2_9CLOT|nr:uridine phosphorylase [Anoxynatronum buryatiense]
MLLPGDPARVLRVADFLDEWKEIAFNREFRTITGTYRGMPVTVTSTGIGGASAAIAVEELAACGVRTMIRIGSAGAVQPGIAIGDLIIAQGAVREDGASRMYVPEAYPAVASPRLTMALEDACRKLSVPWHSGLVRSHDSFYIDEEAALMAQWNRKGVLGSDMETAALLTVARLRGVEAAAILNNVVLYEGDVKEGVGEYVDETTAAAEGEKREIKVALEALYHSCDESAL